MAFAFPPFNINQLAWVALVPLLFAVENCDRGEAFRRGYIAGLTFFGMTVWWLVHVTVPGAIATVAFLALYFGAAAVVFSTVAAWLAKSTAADDDGSRDSLIRNLGAAVIGTTCWVTLEWVRGWFLLGGFPWNFLGVSQWQAGPLIQFANVTGVYGVSALLCFVNHGFYFTIRRIVRQMGGGTTARRLHWEFYVAMMLVCLALWHGIGEIRSGAGQSTRILRLALVQPDIPQSLKFDPNERGLILSRHRQLTETLLADHPDLIVWPETAIPWAVQYDPESAELVTNLLAKSQAHLLTGYFDNRQRQMFNAAILFTPKPVISDIYRKIHLVPFGEYVPLRRAWAPLLRKIGPRDYDVDDFFDLSAGEEYTIFDAMGVRFGAVICYEDTVPSLYRRFVQRDVDFMINLTNDAWFKTSPELETHLANAVFRAIESHRPLVRATNNGVTCVINEHGFITARCAPFKPATLSVSLSLPVDRAQPFYTRHGDVFVALCAVMAVTTLGFLLARSSRIR